MRLKRECGKLCKYILILLVGILIGTCLMTLVYALPTDRMFYNFSCSVDAILRNEGWYQDIYDYDSGTRDCYTEALMIKEAGTLLPPTGENTLQMAMRVYCFSEEKAKHGTRFIEYEVDGKKYSCDSYERYWHGYLVILKPLLMIFTYQDLIYLNMVLCVLLMAWLLIEFYKYSQAKYLVPYVSIVILSVPISIILCLDLSVCFYIAAIATLLILKEKRLQYDYCFLLIGIITSFMDYLTWPLITLGLPLTAVLITQKDTTIKNDIGTILKLSLCWGIGYIGMWSGKWIVASLVLDDNIILDAVREIALRTGNGNEETAVSVADAISSNISVFEKKTTLLILVIISLWILKAVMKYFKYGNCTELLKLMLPYMIIASMPFVWYFATKNHSSIHYWMTWRILLVPVFAIMCGVAKLKEGDKGYAGDGKGSGV